MQEDSPSPVRELMTDESIKAKPLRVCDSYGQILKIFIKMHVDQSKIIIWQQSPNGARRINIGYLQHVDENSGIASFQPYDLQWKDMLKEGATVYFKGEEESILFKISKMKFSNNKLMIRVPQEVRLLEKRKTTRITFDISYKPSKVQIARTSAAKRLAPQDFVFVLFDISDSSAAFKVPHEFSKYFYTGDSIEIESIAGEKCKPTIKATVHYVKPVYADSGFNKQDFRVAVLFKQRLGNVLLRRLQQLANVV